MGPERRRRLLRWSACASVVVALAVLAQLLPLGAAIESLREWVAGHGALGALAFGGVYALAVVALIPGSLLTLAGGAVFGLVLGTIVTSLAATVGAVLALLIARHLARDRVARVARRHPALTAIGKEFGTKGFRLVALLRLSPLVPFSASNYVLGLTDVRVVPFMAATCLGALPMTVTYAYLGHVGGAAAEGSGSRPALEWVLLGVGLAVTAGLTVYLARVARRAIAARSRGSRHARSSAAHARLRA